MTKKGKHTILFICLGNICRSPAAEGIMKSLVEKAGLQDEFEIDSAGIGSWHVGQLPDSRMRKCGAEHGYNFNSHARQFQKSDFARFETIVVMDNENYRAITSMASSEADRKKVVRMADFLPHHREYTTVPDPYYGDYSDFELVITLLEDACQELLTKQQTGQTHIRSVSELHPSVQALIGIARKKGEPEIEDINGTNIVTEYLIEKNK